MGNSVIKETCRQIRSEMFDWRVVSHTPYAIKVLDKRSNIIAEKYQVECKLLEEQWQIYLLRNKNPHFLVALYDIVQQNLESTCSNNNYISIIVEHLPYRLCDLGAISFQQAIYVLKCVLLGSKVLKHNKVQFYLVDESNIAFNKNGQCKFWINENYQLSRPSNKRIIKEQQFVKSLLNVVMERVNQTHYQFQMKINQLSTFTIENLFEIVQKSSSLNIEFMSSICNPEKIDSNGNDYSCYFSKIQSRNKLSLINYKLTKNLQKNKVTQTTKQINKTISSKPFKNKKMSLSNKDKKGSIFDNNKSISAIKSTARDTPITSRYDQMDASSNNQNNNYWPFFGQIPSTSRRQAYAYHLKINPQNTNHRSNMWIISKQSSNSTVSSQSQTMK